MNALTPLPSQGQALTLSQRERELLNERPWGVTPISATHHFKDFGLLVLMSDWHRSKSRCKGAPLMKSGGWLSVQTRRLSSRRTSGVVMGIGARMSRFLPGIAQPTLAGFLVFLAQAGPPASFKCSLGSLAGHRGQC